MKLRSLNILLLLVPLCAAAGDPVSASLNSVPMFYSLSGSNPKYKSATDKAQEAFLIQTGITENVNRTEVAVTKVATEKTTKAIENNTPFKAKDVFFVGGMTYAICVKKQVVQKFKDPVFPSVTHIVTVGKDSGSMLINVPF